MDAQRFELFSRKPHISISLDISLITDFSLSFQSDEWASGVFICYLYFISCVEPCLILAYLGFLYAGVGSQKFHKNARLMMFYLEGVEGLFIGKPFTVLEIFFH